MAKRLYNDINGLDPLAYMGVEESTPSQFFIRDRAPTGDDYNNYNIGDKWLHQTQSGFNNIYILTAKNLSGDTPTNATWTQICDCVGTVVSLSTQSSGPIFPSSGNINVIGADGLSIAGAGSTLTVSVADAVPITFATDGASATPASNSISIVGSGNITTTASNGTITIDLDTDVVNSFLTDSGTATPAAGVIWIVGGTGISTTAAGSTVTLDVTGMSVPIGGTGQTSLTNHGVLVGNATSTINALTPGTNGQLLIGATGAASAFATVTSGGGTVSFTPGAGTLDITVVGAVDIQFNTDSGSATPDMGSIEIIGASGITTSASGNTLTINASGSVSDAFITDSGTATPVGNAVNIVGDGTYITTSGSGNTLTPNLINPLTVPGGGTGAQSFEQHAVLIGQGTSAISDIAVGINGSWLLGATAAAPAFARPTSNDATIKFDFTAGGTDLNVEIVDGLAATYNADVGTATPDSQGFINIVGGTGIDTSTFENPALTFNNVWILLEDPVVVANGGTGSETFNSYGVVCGGTTATGALQSVDPGTSGYILLSNGAGALPSFQSGGSAGGNFGITWNYLTGSLTADAFNGYVYYPGESTAGSYTVTLPASSVGDRFWLLHSYYDNPPVGTPTISPYGTGQFPFAVEVICIAAPSTFKVSKLAAFNGSNSNV